LTNRGVASIATVHASNAFAWRDAGIGAAGALGLLSITVGAAALAIARRRRRIAGD
jgi:hypothetical protein